jgi:hypothetical protein
MPDDLLKEAIESLKKAAESTDKLLEFATRTDAHLTAIEGMLRDYVKAAVGPTASTEKPVMPTSPAEGLH